MPVYMYIEYKGSCFLTENIVKYEKSYLDRLISKKYPKRSKGTAHQSRSYQ